MATMKLHAIPAGTMDLDGGAMFGVVPKRLWSKLVAADADNLTRWAMRCLLVETGGRRVLIDTGAGGKQAERFMRRYGLADDDALLHSLRAAGCAPADVTDVVLTHLHFDHVGGAVTLRGGGCEPVFPNAVHWTTEAQWAAATRPNPRERASYLPENFIPIEEAGILRFWPADGSDPIPGVSMRRSDGHTDGQLIPVIRDGVRTVVFGADLIPSTFHVPLPYIMASDLRPLVLLEEKEALLNEAADNEYSSSSSQWRLCS